MRSGEVRRGEGYITIFPPVAQHKLPKKILRENKFRQNKESVQGDETLVNFDKVYGVITFSFAQE